MSNRDGFGSGFWLGTLVGGVVGGIVGATIAAQRTNRLDRDPDSGMLPGDRDGKRPLKSSRMRSTDRMEVARRSLDDKIGELNNAIDAVRSTIGQPPGESVEALLERTEASLKDRQSISE